MLLPSALACDSSQPRLQSALFISPPSSPHGGHHSSQSAIGNLINSCRNLHSLIAGPAPSPASSASHLPSPPLASMPSPAPRLRRRETKPGATAGALGGGAEMPRYRIKKRAPPPRGLNKRRRSIGDDLGRCDSYQEQRRQEEEEEEEQQQQENIMRTMSDGCASSSSNFSGEKKSLDSGDVFIFRGYQAPPEAERRSPASASAPAPAPPSSSRRAAPSTPKRQRIAPPEVPRGLTREDFHKIGAPVVVVAAPPDGDGDERRAAAAAAAASSSPRGTHVETSEHGDQWSLEDDSRLVEIVLEKVKNMDLSREVWEDCVRNLPGRNYSSVSSRWKNLIKSERIGLQNRGRSRRSKLHGTW